MATVIDDRSVVVPLPEDGQPLEAPAVAEEAVGVPAAGMVPAVARHHVEAVPTPTVVDLPVAQVTTRRRGGPTYDHLVLSQLPLALAVALVFGIIAFAAVRSMPAGGTGGSSAAPAAAGAPAAASGGSASGDPITAFSGGTAAQVVQVAADATGALKWDQATYEAQAGDVTFVVTNKSASTHNFAVEGGTAKAQSANFGSNTTNSYTLKGLPPGEYVIACNFPGHRSAGMVAKLIVH